ncbi:hypothetical protein HY488_02605 [Candidatus Woesearchaeota archaeon]|nr:hypothetical protein [Candidatus Woesearchaeota archaeon]
MKYVMIVPVGDNTNTLFIGIRDFPTERVILLAPQARLREAERIEKDLDRFGIQYRTVEIRGSVWEEMFRTIGEIARQEVGKEIIVNTATGDRATACAATSAAFVNGLKAISIEGNETMLLPVLKFSYYKLLTDKKMALLKLLYRQAKGMSMHELRKTAKMSAALLSYYIHGNLKSEGLVAMGLVEVLEENREVVVHLTMLGRMLVKGYV